MEFLGECITVAVKAGIGGTIITTCFLAMHALLSIVAHFVSSRPR